MVQTQPPAHLLADKRHVALRVLIALQLACFAFYVFDVAGDLAEDGWASLTSLHTMPEMAATLVMGIGIAFQIWYIRKMVRYQKDMEQSLRVASGALQQVMQDYFRQWGLTASEADIATFTVKGFSIAEVATLRHCAEATVKTHLNAIYRKAGVAGRAQLVSVLVEDLLRGPLIGGALPEGGEAPPQTAGADGRIRYSGGH